MWPNALEARHVEPLVDVSAQVELALPVPALDRVLHGKRNRDLQRLIEWIRHRPVEEGRGEAAPLRLQGNEGVPGLEANGHRDPVVLEGEPGEGVGAVEHDLPKAGQAGELSSRCVLDRREQLALEHHRPWWLARFAHPEREEGCGGHVPSVRPIDQLEVLNLSPTSEQDVPGPDAADRVGDLAEEPPREHPG
jgi:hypothetical protein